MAAIELAADHQQPMLRAVRNLLDHHALAEHRGETKRRLDLFARRNADHDPVPLVAKLRFDDHRQADLQRRVPGILRHWPLAGPPPPARRLDATSPASAPCLGDVLGDGAGPIGLGRPDATLPRAIAQLHQAVGFQPRAATHAAPAAGRGAKVSKCNRVTGMPRARAASTNVRVLGPSVTSSAN